MDWVTARSKQSRLVYDALRFAVDGVPYIATGTLQTNAAVNGATTFSGEIRLQSNGVTIARLFANESGLLAVEVNGVVQPW